MAGVRHKSSTLFQSGIARDRGPEALGAIHLYSRSFKNLARQLLHNSYKSAFTGSQRPICESGATVGVRGFYENGCGACSPSEWHKSE